MSHKWYFAPSNGGQTSGLNDSGVSYFKSDPIKSIARETLQDSIDAKHSGEQKVIIKFNLFNVTKSEIPDYDNLREAFKRGIRRWNHHQDTKSFFKQGLDMLEKESIPVLAVSDYRTTGLSKVGNSKTGGWYTLVSSSGVTEKGSTDGGSYGIGKNAPFAASSLRTVLYCTKNRDDEVGFQGVSKIPTIENENSEDTQGIGYFYNTLTNQPVSEIESIQKPYRRSDYGTDKFVLGFNDELNWEERLIEEIINSYLIAIHKEVLEVHVNNFVINKNNLSKTIDRIEKHNKESLALQYYEVLNSSLSVSFKKEFQIDKKTKENVTLTLLVKDGFKKRVGVHRGTGMKIFDKGHFHTPIDFSGIFVVEGKRLNEILRKMEPPTHDNWDPNLFESDPKYAKKLIKEFNKWMSECAKNLLNTQSDKKVEIQGIEEILPDLSNEQAKTKKIDKDAIGDRATEISFKKKRKPRKRTSINQNGDITGGEKRGKREVKGEKKINTPDRKYIRRAHVAKLNVFCLKPDEQIYCMFFSAKTKGEVKFEIKSVGENGKTAIVDIQEAKVEGNSIPVDANNIGPFNIEVAKSVQVEMKINTANRLALEVVQL